jgi:hypothetical protein
LVAVCGTILLPFFFELRLLRARPWRFRCAPPPFPHSLMVSVCDV